MKVFVTGGTGFLGQAVIADLIGKGHAVRALVRDPRARLPEGAESVQSSLLSKDGLREAMRGCEAVMHLAGKVSRDPKDASAMHEVHVAGTKALLGAMEAESIRRLVLASTSGTVAVKKSGTRPATEADHPSIDVIGRWPYYMSKHLQEKEVLAANDADRVDAVILNPSLLLGPGDDRMSSTGDVLKILNGRIPAITEGTVAFVDVRDCAPAFAVALEKGRRGERYLLNGANLTTRSFLQRVALAGDVPMPKLKLPDRWAKLGAKLIEGAYQVMERVPPIDAVSVDMSCHNWSCTWDKAAEELDFSPRDPNETVVDTIRDLENKGLFRR